MTGWDWLIEECMLCRYVHHVSWFKKKAVVVPHFDTHTNYCDECWKVSLGEQLLLLWGWELHQINSNQVVTKSGNALSLTILPEFQGKNCRQNLNTIWPLNNDLQSLVGHKFWVAKRSHTNPRPIDGLFPLSPNGWVFQVIYDMIYSDPLCPWHVHDMILPPSINNTIYISTSRRDVLELMLRIEGIIPKLPNFWGWWIGKVSKVGHGLKLVSSNYGKTKFHPLCPNLVFRMGKRRF